MTPESEEPPPFGKSWGRLYAALILSLAVTIAAFAAFSKAFR